MTARTTPEQYGLPRLDRAHVAATQRQWVAYRTRHLLPEQALVYTVKALRRIDRQLATLRPARDACALSLTVHEQVQALSTVIGVSDSLYRRWRREQPPPRFVPDAVVRLPALAERVAVLEERRHALRLVRDAAALAMAGDEWGTRQVARMLGVDPARIIQLRKEIAAAA